MISALGRGRRAIMCPPQCYGSCMNNQQCMQYSPSMVCIQACCCPLQIDLSTACDGSEAVAMCINGLCGQGWFCNSRNFCCRCQTGSSSGPCVNGLCPTGYACNTNNYCCPLGSGSVAGPCVNGNCPTGYVCGAGNLCYLQQTA
uniref:CC domain-containing protein n=1 Tax=Syphacia muris TaxID=451379 RepID=A0A0N5AU16_9BILA